MGVYEELCDAYWPEPSLDRPQLWNGVIRHAVQRVSPFHIIQHSGWDDPLGGLMMGLRESGEKTLKPRSPMSAALEDIPDMNAITMPWNDLYTRMLHKLVVNASINPLGALLECKNGRLTYNNPAGVRMLRQICKEAYAVLQHDLPPSESANTLADIVLKTVEITTTNTCSMLQDCQARLPTEIDYINGYLCRLAKERNLDAPTNQFIVDLVHTKEKLYMASK
ncbi:hypothetical protein DM01DRAFT_1339974 [Hesseltinella vesiculosa]|uniref:Ketopantoate reductase C-terminal domain-containing protein n=1 Tax=Hesseltinella vesiculosa TaxID=101127 RepID=A0A1X2G597_9FUNG|nr:hypothetical protein DM01DRAFT_1339974 [Hesseltinella vesiculosa]